MRLLQLHPNRLPGPHESTNTSSLPALPREQINQQQLGGCKAAPMQRGAHRAPEHAHSTQLQRGFLFTRTISEHSQRQLESHTMHEQRHMSVDRRFNPFSLDLLCRFQPYFNTVSQTFLWQQGLNLIPPGSEPGLVELKSKSAARSSGWLFPGRKGKIHFASALFCDKKDICPKELLLTCLASGNSSFSD